MKIKRTTRVSFSDDLIFNLPRQWSDLTNSEIRTVFRFMAGTPAEQLPAVLFFMFTGMKINRTTDDKIAACFVVGRRKINVWISTLALAEMCEVLSFIKEPGNVPVRFSSINGRVAVDAQLHGLSFGDFIRLETLYQGYISTQSPEALVRIANILYPAIKKSKPITSLFRWQELMILSWLVQVKSLFADKFKNFFKPAGGEVEAPAIIDIIDNEIRALTGGDVSKESQILEIDCWRALTELDFKAREAEEYNRQVAKMKSK